MVTFVVVNFPDVLMPIIMPAAANPAIANTKTILMILFRLKY